MKLIPLQDRVVLKLMEAEAKKLGVHLVYGFCEKAKEFGVWHYYNSAALISPTRGLIGLYRKCHIHRYSVFNIEGERNRFNRFLFRPSLSFAVLPLMTI